MSLECEPGFRLPSVISLQTLPGAFLTEHVTPSHVGLGSLAQVYGGPVPGLTSPTSASPSLPAAPPFSFHTHDGGSLLETVGTSKSVSKGLLGMFWMWRKL